MYPWSVKADRFSAEVIGAATRVRRVMGPRITCPAQTNLEQKKTKATKS
jgi:hypothetical protein